MIIKLQKGDHTIKRVIKLPFDMEVAIETDKKEIRHWEDKDTGESGDTEMQVPYGYLKFGVYSGDGKLDVFVGSEYEDPDCKVYVVHQLKKPDFKEFDEYKAMLGFESLKQAKLMYLRHYNTDKFWGGADEYTLEEFKDKFLTDTKKAFPSQMGQMGMVPGPITDLNLKEGIDYWMGQIGNLNDDKLRKLSADVWGAGYNYKTSNFEIIREELCGFLLDEVEAFNQIQDLLTQMNPPGMETSQEQDSSVGSQNSSNGQSIKEDPSEKQNLKNGESEISTSKDSSNMASSKKFPESKESSSTE